MNETGFRCKTCGHFVSDRKGKTRIWVRVCPKCGDEVTYEVPEKVGFFRRLFKRGDFPMFRKRVTQKSVVREHMMWLPFIRTIYIWYHLPINAHLKTSEEEYRRGVDFIFRGKWESAISALQMSIKSAPPYDACMIQKAISIAHYEAGHLHEAVRSLETCLVIMGRMSEREITYYGLDVDLYCLQGFVFRNLGYLDKSLAILRRVFKLYALKSPSNSANTVLWTYLGLTHLERNEFDSALEFLRMAAYLGGQHGHDYGKIAADCWAYMAESYGKLALEIAKEDTHRGQKVATESDQNLNNCLFSAARCYHDGACAYGVQRNNLEWAIIHNNEAIVEYLQNKVERAIRLFVLSLEEFDRSGDAKGTRIVLQNLSIVSDQLGERRVLQVCEGVGITKQAVREFLMRQRKL